MTNERAQALIEVWDERGYDLGFVENAGGTTVHVVAPAGEASSDISYKVDALGPDVVDFVLGVVMTVCGLRIRCNRGGQQEGGRLVGRFRDDLLCMRCHAAFGDRSDLIFECNREERE